MRRAKSASSLTGGRDQNQDAWAREERDLQTGVLEGRRWGRRGRSHLNSLGLEPRHFPSSSPLGEPEGWAWAGKELNLIPGFCGLGDALEFKIEIDVFM